MNTIFKLFNLNEAISQIIFTSCNKIIIQHVYYATCSNFVRLNRSDLKPSILSVVKLYGLIREPNQSYFVRIRFLNIYFKSNTVKLS